MTNRKIDFLGPMIAVVAAAAVVGGTTVALVAAIAAEAQPAAGNPAMFSNNLILDALAAPNFAAIIVLGSAIAVAAAMRARAKARVAVRPLKRD